MGTLHDRRLILLALAGLILVGPLLLLPLLLDISPDTEPARTSPKPAPEDVAEEPSPAAPSSALPPLGPQVPEPTSPLLAAVRAEPKAFAGLVEAMRTYFDPEEEPWRGRLAVLSELEKQAGEGRYFLKDMPALRWLVAQGRSFLPDLRDRRWQRTGGIGEARKLDGTRYWIKSEHLTVSFSVPRNAPHAKEMRRVPRPGPLPLLLTLHAREDCTGQKFPGDTCIKRRYGDKDVWGPLYDDWFILAPTAAAAHWLGPGGKPRAEVFTHAFSTFWKHYHVDFDRVLLDGEAPAFSIATAMPIFFAGIVFRGHWTLDDAQKAQVSNFAHVPVYVVDNPDLVRQLQEAGHPDVTGGGGGRRLLTWMQRRRRLTAKAFRWNAARTDQALAYWINLDGAIWGAPTRTVDVRVVDSETEPNTIKIDAVGVAGMSLFLNDEIVDLDRPVRLDVNGFLEHNGRIPLEDDHMAKVGRDFDFLFNREPLKIRTSMYFGWLTPARVAEVAVRRRDVQQGAVRVQPDTPRASAEEEQRAERYLLKARAFYKQGNTEKATEYLGKILALPSNTWTEEAQRRLADLDRRK